MPVFNLLLAWQRKSQIVTLCQRKHLQEDQMNMGTKLQLNTEANGTIIISNDRSCITVQPDGTIAVSSLDPVQLTGACAAKLDNSALPPEMVVHVIHALGQRIDKK